jgi:sialate O-acetylesterase
LINAALGGSPVESWMSEDAIRNFPSSYQEFKKFQDDAVIKETEKKATVR